MPRVLGGSLTVATQEDPLGSGAPASDYRRRNAFTPVVLMDGSEDRAATRWASRIPGALPFDVVPEGTDLAYAGVWDLIIDAGPVSAIVGAAHGRAGLIVVPSLTDVASIRETGAFLERCALTSNTVVIASRTTDVGWAAGAFGDLPVLDRGVREHHAYREARELGCLVNTVEHADAARLWAEWVLIGRRLTAWWTANGTPVEPATRSKDADATVLDEH